MKDEMRIFPDIRLICNDNQMTEYADLLEISCCLRGISEYRTESGYSYLTKGHYHILKHDKYSECSVTHSANCRIMTILIDSRSGNKDIYELTGSADYIHELQNNRAYIFFREIFR